MCIKVQFQLTQTQSLSLLFRASQARMNEQKAFPKQKFSVSLDGLSGALKQVGWVFLPEMDPKESERGGKKATADNIQLARGEGSRRKAGSGK